MAQITVYNEDTLALALVTGTTKYFINSGDNMLLSSTNRYQLYYPNGQNIMLIQPNRVQVPTNLYIWNNTKGQSPDAFGVVLNDVVQLFGQDDNPIDSIPGIIFLRQEITISNSLQSSQAATIYIANGNTMIGTGGEATLNQISDVIYSGAVTYSNPYAEIDPLNLLYFGTCLISNSSNIKISGDDAYTLVFNTKQNTITIYCFGQYQTETPGITIKSTASKPIDDPGSMPINSPSIYFTIYNLDPSLGLKIYDQDFQYIRTISIGDSSQFDIGGTSGNIYLQYNELSNYLLLKSRGSYDQSYSLYITNSSTLDQTNDDTKYGVVLESKQFYQLSAKVSTPSWAEFNQNGGQSVTPKSKSYNWLILVILLILAIISVIIVILVIKKMRSG